ncbi:tetratricopeptide repeat protein [Dactylosporangium sp. AC04546]|uniref:J domain-containing protein n=1 Tax=Dactylosporangium sp. AC04546 TaxID=2862460 RepID=UPI001EDECCB0|nr:tetratricopeptide repeat protein [Dactylosporangium sp. AC04546]WVK84243.1 tetratricopeptide repeat protein [Dactylosporangium sp. AC04546]
MTIDSTRFVDFYNLLGVAPDASAADIKTAIKEKRRTFNARQSHPEPKTRAHAEQVMRDLDEAERTLLHAERRREYDRHRPARQAQAQAVVPSSAPSAVGDWEDRARHFLDNDNPLAAHRVAQEWVTSAPGNSTAWTVRGQASALIGNFQDAEYELAEASRLSPAEAFPSYLLGEVYAAQEKWKSALNQYDKALAMEPENPVYGTSKARLFLANDKPKAAVKIMEPIVKRFPEDQVFKYHLAMAYHDAALEELPQLPNGGHIWTSEEQIQGLERAATRIDRLKCKDSDVREAASSLRKFAAEGREIRWDTAAPNLYVGLGVTIFIFACAGCFNTTESFGAAIFLGLLIGGGAAFGLFAAVRRKPAWKLAEQALGKGNLTQQMQDVGNRVGLFAGRFLG